MKKTGIMSVALLMMLTGCKGGSTVEGNAESSAVASDAGTSESEIAKVAADDATTEAAGEAPAEASSEDETVEVVGDGIYERFLRNEVPVKIGEKENLGEYFNFEESQGQECTLEELVNLIIDGYTEGEGSGAKIRLESIEYAFLDCGNDGNRELAIRIRTPSVDEWTENIIIKDKAGKLETIYSDVAWSRSRICMNEYGYIYGDGSGGAASHGFDKAYVDADCKYHFIYSDFADYPESSYVYFSFDFNNTDESEDDIDLYALIDENDKFDKEDDSEYEDGYRSYFFSKLVNDDSLYEESGEIYKHVTENGYQPDGKLVTVSEIEKMIADKEKQEGLTEEIKNGEPLEWKKLKYSFEPEISSYNADNILGIKEYFPLGFWLHNKHDGNSSFSIEQNGEMKGHYDYYIFENESEDGESHNYENEFTGSFTVEEKVNDHIFKLRLSDYKLLHEPGTTRTIRDGVSSTLYVDVPGMEEVGEHYILYAPGTKISEIDPNALSVFHKGDNFDGDILTSYLLYESDGDNNVWGTSW